MSMAPEAIARQIADATAKCGITTIASLPDGWITDLITAYAQDNRFRHLAVNREQSAIGFCSGAYLGGVGSMALMGASGFLRGKRSVSPSHARRERVGGNRIKAVVPAKAGTHNHRDQLRQRQLAPCL